MKILGYWLVRTALFLAALVAFWVVGWRHWSVAIGAAVVGWAISYALLGAMYDSAAKQMEAVLARRAARMRSDAAAEDVEATADAAPGSPKRKKATPRQPTS